jgi:N-dimethylarginine dimethylaminohydrolase
MVKPLHGHEKRMSETLTGPKGTTIPSTFGGPGFELRLGAHQADLGTLWAQCGQDSEWTDLQSVMLAWPPDSLEFEGDPDAVLMLERPDLELARLQAEILGEAFEEQGVQVHWARPAQVPPPNFIFMRDLVFMTPEGAVLARPASPVRAAEARAAAECLAAAGIPIIATIHGDGIMEGADCLWMRPNLVLIGVGHRTNASGLAQLVAVLSRMGVATRAVPVPRGSQHLLGVVTPLDHDLAVVDRERCSRALRAVLVALEIELVELEPSDELRDQRGMNLVTLGPRKVLMPADCPEIRSMLESHGVTVVEAEVTEYVKAGGAVGCLTAIIGRAPCPALESQESKDEEHEAPPVATSESSDAPELEAELAAEEGEEGEEVVEQATPSSAGVDDSDSEDTVVRFDDSESEDWAPPPLLELSTEEVHEADSTEVVVEWEESQADPASD